MSQRVSSRPPPPPPSVPPRSSWEVWFTFQGLRNRYPAPALLHPVSPYFSRRFSSLTTPLVLTLSAFPLLAAVPTFLVFFFSFLYLLSLFLLFSELECPGNPSNPSWWLPVSPRGSLAAPRFFCIPWVNLSFSCRIFPLFRVRFSMFSSAVCSPV